MPLISKNISEIFEDIVKEVSKKLNYNVSFEFGDWLEVAKELTEKKDTQTFMDIAYPCIFIHSDIKEKIDKYNSFNELDNLEVYILTDKTTNELTTKQRLKEVYNKLYDIEAAFINEIERSKNISWYNHNYEGANKYFLRVESKDQNQLNDVVDAIFLELKGLKIPRNDC